MRVLCLLLIALPAMSAELSPGFSDLLADAGPDEIVSGMVYLEDQVDLPELVAQLDAQEISPRERHERVILSLQAMAATTQPRVIRRLEDLKSRGLVEGYTTYWISNMIVVAGKRSAFFELAPRVDVGLIEVNFEPELIEPISRGTSGQYPDVNQVTPGIRQIKADSVWYVYGITGARRMVSNVDTGVYGFHPAFYDRWAGDKPGYLWNWAWHDIDEFPTTFPDDVDWHGTHTMGTMCGLGEPTADTIGVAWGAWWIASRTIDQLGQNNTTIVSRVADAFQWLADPDGDLSTSWDVPDVCNNSWGVPTSPPFGNCYTGWQTEIDALETAGCAVIFSSGNSGPSASSVKNPANYCDTEVTNFSVGAVDEDSVIASFSGRGPSLCVEPPALRIKPEVVARGVDVFSSIPPGYQGGWSGTSMSSPHVAGVFALMREAYPGITVGEMKDILITTAYDLGSEGNDNSYGYGLVDALAAVEDALAISDCGWVEGTVTDGGSPVEGVKMTLRDYETDITDASGVYHAGGQEGTHWLVWEKYGCVTDSVQVSVAANDTVTEDVSIVALGTGTLQGTCYSVTGWGVQNFIVRIIGSDRMDTTNSGGWYQFLNVAEGTYDLWASHPNFVDDTATVIITADDTTTQNFVLGPANTYLGPDSYGYYCYDYLDTLFAEAPAFGWFDISDQYDCDMGNNYIIGFNMSFMQLKHYGTSYDNVYFSDDGCGMFVNDGYAYPSNYFIPDDWGPTAMMAAFWDNFDPQTTANDDGEMWASIVYATEQEPPYDTLWKALVVQWDSVAHRDPYGYTYPSLIETFQIWVYDTRWPYYTAESGDAEIEFYYMSFNDWFGATVGIENEAEDDGIQYYVNGAYYDVGGRMMEKLEQVEFTDFSSLPMIRMPDEIVAQRLGLASSSIEGAAPLGGGAVVKFTTDPPGIILDKPREGASLIPSTFALRAAFPNPFNPTTTLSFDLPASSYVRLDVFDVLGRRVATLVDGELPAGSHSIVWDASNVGSGVYFTRIVSDVGSATTKMVLLK
jgi:DNA-binding Lrp family transcriptional regulator